MSLDFMIPIVALSLPGVLVFIHRHFRYKEKVLELQARGLNPPQLPARADSNDERVAELETRVQNLESIIVAMDSELGSLPGRAAREDLRRIGSATPALAAAGTSPTPRLAASKPEPET